MLNLANFWQGKKIAALVLTFVVVIVTMIVNQTANLGLDPTIILSILGLNALYILRQGSIDSKKTDQNAFKPFWESRKFLAVAVGNLVPIIIGFVGKKYNLEISTEIIYSLLGIDAVYLLRQGALDVKAPNEH